MVSPNEVGVDVAYDGTAGTGVVGTITGVALRAALAAAFPEAQSALRWWYAQAFVATVAAGLARYLGVAIGALTLGGVLRGNVPFGRVTMIGGTANANQLAALTVNANGDDVEVAFLGAVAARAWVNLGIKPSIIV
jgi:hypothetical protein